MVQNTGLLLPPVPPLINWTETHYTAILQSTNSSAFNEAFNDFLSQNASITLNGSSISRDKYQSFLSGEQGAESVTFYVATAATTGVEFGDGSFCYKAEYPNAPVIDSCFNVTVEEDPSIIPPPPPPPPAERFFDGRRVFSLSQVTLDDTD